MDNALAQGVIPTPDTPGHTLWGSAVERLDTELQSSCVTSSLSTGAQTPPARTTWWLKSAKWRDVRCQDQNLLLAFPSGPIFSIPKDAQGAPSQSHVSLSIVGYEDERFKLFSSRSVAVHSFRQAGIL